jgi:serine protease Do
MQRSGFKLAVLSGAIAAMVAIPVVSTIQHRSIASDAHAASAVAAPPSTAQDAKQLGPMPSLSPLVKQVRGAVVNVSSKFRPHPMKRTGRQMPQQRPFGGDGQGPGDDEQGPEDPMERFYRFFGGRPQQDDRERHGLGSGFLIGDGLVLTNNHVVEIEDENRPGHYRPMDEIKVLTDSSSPGGAREFTAKVIGNDPKSDVALLKLEGDHVKELKFATLGDSDAAEVGDYVMAIGEPFGLQATVTSGIVSAKERSQFGGAYSDYLQTDAAINPGNSGGPLFNMKGEVIGINAAILSGANTIGFAIPIAVVKQILPQLKEKGHVSRGFLGVQPQAITQDMAPQLGLKDTRGALVTDVVKGSPAEKAGLKPGDVVVAMNGHPVDSDSQLTRDVGIVPPGGTVHLEAIREGKPVKFDVKLAGRPEEVEDGPKAKGDRGSDQSQGDPLGLSVEDVTPELSRRARLEDGAKGAVVVDVAQDSPASNAGIEPGDLVVEMGRQPVSSAADYRKAVKALKKGDTALVRVRRGPGAVYVPVRVK